MSITIPPQIKSLVNKPFMIEAFYKPYLWIWVGLLKQGRTRAINERLGMTQHYNKYGMGSYSAAQIHGREMDRLTNEENRATEKIDELENTMHSAFFKYRCSNGIVVVAMLGATLLFGLRIEIFMIGVVFFLYLIYELYRFYQDEVPHVLVIGLGLLLFFLGITNYSGFSRFISGFALIPIVLGVLYVVLSGWALYSTRQLTKNDE